MTTATRISAAIGCSAALLIGTAGVASAAVTPEIPSGDFQLCGNVYTDAPWVPSGTPDPSATPLEDVEVTGELFASGGTTPVATYQTTTNAGGGFCIQGDASLVFYITVLGGRVVLDSEPAPVPNTWTTTGITLSDFEDHEYGLTSANEFYLTM